MKRIYHDKKYSFLEVFDLETGFYVRSGVIENKIDTNVDPFMRSMPGLIDIGIMGHCSNTQSCKAAGIDCYQGTSSKANMSFEDYRKIIDECAPSLFQVALGGHGDPNKHENFRQILEYTKGHRVVPNYTTSGINLTDEEIQATKEFCGAVAVSYQRAEHTFRAIERFMAAGVKTNIHYVLGEHTIDEAILRLERNDWPLGVNAIIFLLYKPVGLGIHSRILSSKEKISKFFSLIDNHEGPYKIGFDSCTIPALIQYAKSVDMASVDTCEGARYSMYITSDMMALPCSFDQEHRWAVDLNKSSIQEAWNSDKFGSFREHFTSSCSGCLDRHLCMGGCPIKNEINICSREQRSHNEFVPNKS